MRKRSKEKIADESATVKISYGKETRGLCRHAYRLPSFQRAEVFIATFVYSFVYHARILLIAPEIYQLSFPTSTSSHFHFPDLVGFAS
jgi:hypothetical protein